MLKLYSCTRPSSPICYSCTPLPDSPPVHVTTELLYQTVLPYMLQLYSCTRPSSRTCYSCTPVPDRPPVHVTTIFLYQTVLPYMLQLYSCTRPSSRTCYNSPPLNFASVFPNLTASPACSCSSYTPVPDSHLLQYMWQLDSCIRQY